MIVDKIIAARNVWDERIHLYWKRAIYNSNFLDAVHRAEPMRFFAVTKENEGIDSPPLISLEPDVAQQLMDRLWDQGVRPSEGQGSAGHLAAVQSHLSDMRKLTAHVLKMGDKF